MGKGSRRVGGRAPTLYLEDGTPVKVRLVASTCVGDVSGEGHYGYRHDYHAEESATVYFEEVEDSG